MAFVCSLCCKGRGLAVSLDLKLYCLYTYMSELYKRSIGDIPGMHTSPSLISICLVCPAGGAEGVVKVPGRDEGEVS